MLHQLYTARNVRRLTGDPSPRLEDSRFFAALRMTAPPPPRAPPVIDQIEPQSNVPSVLVIAIDPNIESLLGELVAFAGYRPLYDVTAGAAGESIRRVRPDITLLDTALPPAIVEACLGAADEVGSRPVL